MFRTLRFATVFLTAGRMTALAAGDLAVEAQDVTLERFRPLANPHALGGVDSAEIPGHLEWDVAGHVNYGQDLLVLVKAGDRGDRVGLVGHRVGGEGAAYLGLFDYVAIGMNAPATVLQLRTEGTWVPAPDTLAHLMPAVAGDVRPMVKARVLRQERHLVSLALVADVTVPTSLGLAYGGERTPTFSPQVVLSRSWWGIQLMGQVGARFRGVRALGRQSLTDELNCRLGVGYDFCYFFRDVCLTPYMQATGHTSLIYPFGAGLSWSSGVPADAVAQNGLEWGPGLRWEVVDGLQLVGGLDWGILPGVGTPTFRVYSGVRLAHRVRDLDGDGVVDSADRCVKVREDRDGFLDSDGCPDIDNDHDNRPDETDKCPDVGEDLDGVDDHDGCPDPDNDQDAVMDAQDACPAVAGSLSNHGCPEADADQDEIRDALDQCPLVPEDGDGHDDGDGCPDPDNDADGLLDAVDACPFEPEDADDFEPDDGCPELDDDADGVIDALDECPKDKAPPERAALGEGCPDGDTDLDAISDSLDQCPEEAEDRDGFSDGDGCPDGDNDSDGVTDRSDGCPTDPETINGWKDADGCPDEGPKPLVRLASKEIEILEKIYFDSTRARIQRRSHGLLDQLALLLLANPQVLRVAIEGHTDNKGNGRKNLVLSQKRAEAVRAYLINKAVAPARLRAVGYGETRPFASNASALGREANRRVEFVLE
jgi:outer membrane protein OmpA-like peptidoglycan-associated protein